MLLFFNSRANKEAVQDITQELRRSRRSCQAGEIKYVIY